MNELYEQYKQTIMDILTCWEEHKLFSLDDKLSNHLSTLLHIDINDLLNKKKPLSELTHNELNQSVIQKATIFNLIMKYGVTKINLNDVIIDPDCVGMVGLYFSELQTSIDWLITSNSDLMNIVSENLDLKNTLFDDPYSNPIILVNSIQTWSSICTEKNESQICQIIGLMSRLCKYEISAKFDAIYLIAILSLIISSGHFDDSIINLANEVRDYLFFILKNGKVIGIYINKLSPHVAIEDRTSEDNTTRFQLIYSFGNYDAYCLRFDLPHKGVEFTHINNISPGKKESCLFTEEEYNNLVNDNESLKNCFIKYGSQYAIREKASNDSDVDKEELNRIISSKEHEKILKINYSEETINSFIEILSYCLPGKCLRVIDTNYEIATNIFHYNIAMRNLFWAIILFEAGKMKQVEKVLDSIVEMAHYWGDTDKTQVKNIAELNELLNQMMEKAEKE